MTLSSGEAEFYWLVKAAGAGLGHQSLVRDMGMRLPVCIWTDSSAALGISTRSGLGKLRHLETHTLWVQEKVRVGAIAVRKVRGEVNPADLFTKHLPSKDKLRQLTFLFGCEYRVGRAAIAPLLRPHGSEKQGGNLLAGEVLPNFVVDEVGQWDLGELPHLKDGNEIARLFPRIAAAPLVPNADDWEPGREYSSAFLSPVLATATSAGPSANPPAPRVSVAESSLAMAAETAYAPRTAQVAVGNG